MLNLAVPSIPLKVNRPLFLTYAGRNAYELRKSLPVPWMGDALPRSDIGRVRFTNAYSRTYTPF